MIPAVKRIVTLPAVCSTVAVLACGGPRENPQLLALAQQVPPPATVEAVLFRITDRALRFYTFPGLAEVGWNIAKRGLAVDAVVGFAPETQQLLVINDDSVLTAFDLASGLVLVVDSSVSLATIGPNGVPYVVGKGGAVGSIARRRLAVWSDSIALDSRRIWGAYGGRLLSEFSSGETRTLRMFSSSDAPSTITVPPGPMAISRWAELVAIATPSAVELFGTMGEVHDPSVIDVLEGPLQVVFSGSGHRIYVTTTGGKLLWFDRFSGARLNSLQIGSTGPMRVGSLGRFLFIQQEGRDSVYVFDIRRNELVVRLATRWTASTPSVAPDGTILVRQQNDIVALDPESFLETGRVEGDAGDVWATASWTPAQPVSRQAPEQAEDHLPGEGNLYVQVSSSQNQAWAQDLAVRLNRAGMEALVLNPEGKEELYRVVLGPFGVRDEAESAGRRLGRPYWIFSPTDPQNDR